MNVCCTLVQVIQINWKYNLQHEMERADFTINDNYLTEIGIR